MKKLKHPECPRKGKYCIHPVYGIPTPLGDRYPGMIYSDHQFQRDGEATEEQVKYVISRMQCADTQWIEDLLEEGRAKSPGQEQRTDKYRLLRNSAVWLNRFVKNCCPGFVDMMLED